MYPVEKEQQTSEANKMKICIEGLPKDCFNAEQDLGDRIDCIKEKIPHMEWDPDAV